jgi:hypothetical protein
MPDCSASGQSGTEVKKCRCRKQFVTERKRPCQVKILRYRTEITDFGLPIPAASVMMPTPSILNGKKTKKVKKSFKLTQFFVR